MSYAPGERDLVVLQHKFVVEWLDGTKVEDISNPTSQDNADLAPQETLTSTLELLGDTNGFSTMARSVGVTRGIATQLLLDGHSALRKPGVLAPYTKEICDPIRKLLEREGVNMVEEKLV
jgi:saccharopine dehydrogenase (NADP+, L-glutamate forming)